MKARRGRKARCRLAWWLKKTVDEWKALLRARLRAQDKPALIVLRETLAAIENAESPPMTTPAPMDGPFQGSAGGQVRFSLPLFDRRVGILDCFGEEIDVVGTDCNARCSY